MDTDIEFFVEKLLSKIKNNVNEVSLKKFCSEYAEYVKRNRASKTYEGVLLVNKKLLSYFSPVRLINTIQLKDAENFIDSLKKTAPKAHYNYLRVLKSMFSKAIEWNYLKENPFTKVKLQTRQILKPTYVKEDQLEIILINTEEDVVKDVIITAFYTGCRLGEITNLTWSDVDLENDLIAIGSVEFKTKVSKQRFIPTHQKVKDVLIKRFKETAIGKIASALENKSPSAMPIGRQAPSASLPNQVQNRRFAKGGLIFKIKKKNYVFCKKNGFAFTPDFFSKHFKRACRIAEMPEELHFHSLRHGAATRMVNNGAPLPSVQKILGHSKIETTMIYTHPEMENLRDAVNRL